VARINLIKGLTKALRVPARTPARERIAEMLRQREAEELEHALTCEDPACSRCNGWVND
jgi:hypothetical protein